MKIKSDKQEEYNKGIEVNSNCSYGMTIFEFANRWAELMEADIENGVAIKDCAEKHSTTADNEARGITGYMYGAAVSILSQCWEHGEELRKWHNKEYNHEGEGVVNPAILTIG